MDNMELSLDPVEKPQSIKDSTLSEQIIRITQERGSFADITEDSLEKEIEESKTRTETASEASETEIEQFEQKRALLSTKIRSALNESALSLDFVSLLVSCLRPQAGASSMSPMLKGQVPIGTLSGDTISTSSILPTLAQTRGDPGYGWKLLALDDASNKLIEAEERLTAEVAKEQRFWDQILGTIRNGEKIFKQKRNLRVKYGYKDSGSKYSKNGQGALERSSNGDMVFKPDVPSSNKVVCVTVHKNDQINSLAYSVCESDCSIKRARHHLFEDELFFYLVEEARRLDGHRVSLTDNGIVCQLHECVLEITHVGLDEIEDHENEGPLANVVCNCLHLLLNARHNENLERSHQIPAPLDSSTVRTSEQLPILKSVLAHMQQSTVEQRTVKLIEMMLPNSTITHEPRESKVDSPLELLTKCPASIYKIKAKEREINLTINSPLESVETFEAETGERRGTFYDLAELEPWLRALE